ncbi:hypothetical protein ACQJBY_022144 [Aegilops geniculata]
MSHECRRFLSFSPFASQIGENLGHRPISASSGREMVMIGFGPCAVEHAVLTDCGGSVCCPFRASSNRVHQEEGQPKVDEGRKPTGCPANRFRTSLLQYLTASHSLQPANHLYWLLPLLTLAR